MTVPVYVPLGWLVVILTPYQTVVDWSVVAVVCVRMIFGEPVVGMPDQVYELVVVLDSIPDPLPKPPILGTL